MAANKKAERFATFTMAVPAAVNISSGQPLSFGHGTHVAACVAIEAQNTTDPTSDPNSGYLTLDFEGVYNLTVVAETLGSVSAGAAVNVGDPLYLSGGTFDKTTGITYGGTLCCDANGDFFGLAMAPLAAGATGIIPVLLKNAC